MIVFISNFLNHHQYPVAKELYHLSGGKYRFIETEPMPDWIKKGGYSEYEGLPWLIQTWKKEAQLRDTERLILEADVVVWCHSLFINQIKERLKNNRLTFEFGERWLKRGLLNLLSPNLLKSQFYYHCYFFNKPLYRLNASAYAANDLRHLLSFKNKMFKWGYFTTVPEYETASLEASRDVSRLRILFVARFLVLKHPELPVLMAHKLKQKGVDFELNMYGSGPELAKIQSLIKKFDVGDIVNLCGNRPNSEILSEMRKHDIFLFTSDRNEGWGAVVNEAMSNKCTVVAADEIGSVPFLIKSGDNGLIFKSKSVEDLTNKVEYLLQNPHQCRIMGERAYQTLKNEWSPRRAAENFIRLIHGIKNGNPNIIPEGPCSKANPINRSTL